jgi:Mor family transcriptional regulator
MPSLSGAFAQEFMDLTAALVDAATPELSPERRRAMAQGLVAGFCNLWAGGYIYVPYRARLPGVSPEYKQRRDALIRDEHDGSELSVHRLARRYGLSEIAVYRVLSDRALADPPRTDAAGLPA